METDAQFGRRKCSFELSSKAHGDLDGASNEIAPRAGCANMRILSRLTLELSDALPNRVDTVKLHSSAASQRQMPKTILRC